MKNLSTLILVLIVFQVNAQQRNLAEKLGYAPNDKLLIIHADDIGLAHSENIATVAAMKNGVVNSTSIMMPSPWATEVAELVKDMPDIDLGVHITLTDEWFNYRWGPISSKSEVSGLVGEDGYFHFDCASVAQNASPEEVEKEMRAQIDAAIAIGIKPTHLDSHMGCVFSGRPEFVASYLRLAEEYGIPAMVVEELYQGVVVPNQELFAGIDLNQVKIVDNVAIGSPEIYDSIGLSAYYTDLLKNLQPGLNVLLIHVAYDDEEMRAITTRFDHWHARWRQKDFDFFTSERAKKLLEENNIKLVTWKEIGKL
ncbi:Cellobiose phosphotransferase system YdjC-like protein [Indibacter alkaliphilus LW1]|uniref:Cellobiose phosphotransferase system YdjC-like protein n=1 Tax=Indibacter alkaliphilus (strain CCUG 57479 / KCTC 22604 / LW1) TaxID=1189612 RepID=S2DFU2_INDAL|nr:polysaccharide deacetylase family protein [Indibacter alkaliphilus]EOZ95930.1 Cellobiose phosphotransferase system YdjC-like protein [Indibacter alkaliphilus LW1]